MCRHLAYLGPPLTLRRVLLDPPHNLIEQAIAPQELVYARVNADGFGFGWFSEDGTARCYRRADPLWQDPNLQALAETLEEPLWISAIRSATPGFGGDTVNAQPFAIDGLLYSHNGLIGGFRPQIRRQIENLLTPEIEAGIQGTTDSEYLFALVRQFLADDENATLEGALGEAFSTLETWLGDEMALLNILLSDGRRLVASRHAINSPCPSLYYTSDDDDFPEDSVIVASEPLTDRERWRPVPSGHILILDPDEPPELLAL
ncbi:ergothioneine biosynthesis protein EgtC [Thioalkalivibrio sp. HL-Eb18]|uniref:ergothioneine biosynthesis protein EgtC n=1 Tax=Thioalkalivibrio sp. HL-Eb18 TaxID=1266913 RepID=UPI0004772FF0|nr:ergothioneine biosynthesis protein EgtC [Thioalkalivibrio sp. HL-Eb18]